MASFKDYTVKGFCDELSSNSAVPGGGSVSALSSSLSCSLVSMVTNLTIGKKFYLSYDEELKNKFEEIKEESNRLKDEFLDFVDKDVDAFNIVMSAFKLPKDTIEEKDFRLNKIQEGYIESMRVPLEVAKKTTTLFDFFATCLEHANPNCASDLGVGVLQAELGIKGAIMNVEINLKSIKDEALVRETTQKVLNIKKITEEKVAYLMSIVNEKLQ